MSYLTENDIEHQAMNYLDSRQPFGSWVKSKGFSQEDTELIKQAVRKLKSIVPCNRNVLVYSITPKIEDGVISFTEAMNGEVTNKFVKEVMDTKDKAIRQALIALGWTPPKEDA